MAPMIEDQVREAEADAAIELRVDEISQLFDTLDPFPFRERDLDEDAEAYFVGWARELPKDRPIRIIVHIPIAEATTENALELGTALKHYFDYRAGAVVLDLNELFRIGRRSIAIGMCALAVCIAIGRMIAGQLGAGYLARFVEEGLIILGWVANWKPIEIFLYDWWPLVRQRNLYRRLAAATVELRPYPPKATHS